MYRTILILTLVFFSLAHGPNLPAQDTVTSLQLVDRQKSEISRIVLQGIEQGEMAGCVVAIGDRNGLVYLEAFGNRQVEPVIEAMTADTVFDLASLTKPVATATSIFKLVEQNRIDLAEPACQYWTDFGKQGKAAITIGQLLTHQAGLIPDNPLSDYDHGTEQAMENLCNLNLASEPGTKFAYSDVGFIVLGEIVRRVSGKDIATFSREQIFQPLKMLETSFVPPPERKARSATTEQVEQQWLKGNVHDPRAARMGGVAGHAGLFSTASDLSRLARMLLQQGNLDGVEVLKPVTVEQMTLRRKIAGGFRTLGWDSLSGYSSNRGDLFSDSAFGHGGFTGTSFWVDPDLDLFVIFLSNRLHPDGKGSVNSLAGRIGTIAASSRLQDRLDK